MCESVGFSHILVKITKFQKKYTELHLLGEGGFGSVFAGYRQKDKLPVGVFGIFKRLLMEELLLITFYSSGQLALVSLLDWYELEEELVLVMERPMPSEDLFYWNLKGLGRVP
uniref:non-specific serine/threonine protein kinase n=1 Tax=Poecilia latipinna TaxID=48699 RepID=A0A3B3V9A5_9TELE